MVGKGRCGEMKIGVVTVPLYAKKLPEALMYLKKIGVDAAEVGAGGFPGDKFCNPKELLGDKQKLRAFKALFSDCGIELNALSCHRNPVHPNKEIARKSHEEFVDTVHLAEELGIRKVITFSGCPGDSPTSQYPNWVTCPWPDDFLEVLDYQWNDCLLPYWQKAGQIARESGVRVALEMHPGFCVYNTASMLRIRREIGDVMGANLDPSHLIWQGNDITASIRELKDAIYHFHAKDCRIDVLNTGRKGALDTVAYSEQAERSWQFCTVGYGHGQEFWKNVVAALRIAGYDDVLSIEHEDGLMSEKEGLEKAVLFLQDVIIREDPSQMWWA